jgi:hypothetical protein
MLVFNKYFYKNKKSKLYFRDRVAVLKDFIYQTRGSMNSLCGTEPEAEAFTGTSPAIVKEGIKVLHAYSKEVRRHHLKIRRPRGDGAPSATMGGRSVGRQ